MSTPFSDLTTRISHWNFHYSLTRKYPFAWLKWTTVILFPFLFVLFTVINVAANGYELQSVYTTDPNTTISRGYWFNNAFFHWGDSRLRPKCQPSDVAVGSQFVSTNFGFLYTIRNISSISQGFQGSVAYTNNTLHNCQVDKVLIEMGRNDNRGPNDVYYWSWFNTGALAQARCDVVTDEGESTIHLETSYSSKMLQPSQVIDTDPQKHASLWWGVQLLENHMFVMRALMARIFPRPDIDSDNHFTHVRMTFATRSQSQSIDDDALFENPKFQLNVKDGEMMDDVNAKTQWQYNTDGIVSAPMTEGLSLSKDFYSAVLVDLGEVNRPNLLLDQVKLQEALDTKYNFNRDEGRYLNDVGRPNHDADEIHRNLWRGIAPPGLERQVLNNTVPMADAYRRFGNQTGLTGQLGTKSATIHDEYLCSIPSRRSLGAVILSVLLANIVLLRTSWVILKFIAEQVVSARDPQAMYCEGCVSRGNSSEVTLANDQSDYAATSFENLIPRKAVRSAMWQKNGYTTVNDHVWELERRCSGR